MASRDEFEILISARSTTGERELQNRSIQMASSVNQDMETKLCSNFTCCQDDEVRNAADAFMTVSETDGIIEQRQTESLDFVDLEMSLEPWVQYAISALSALSGFLFGYDLCVMVIALPLIEEAYKLSKTSAQTIVSTLMIGAVFGSLFGGAVSDRIGRKPAVMSTACLFFSGSIVMTFALSYYQLLLGRFIVGIAVGSSGPCVSVYISEIAEAKQRGALVTLNEVMLCFGCLSSLVISGLLQDSVEGWRKMLGATLLPPILQLIGMPFLPESARWLHARKLQLQERRQSTDSKSSKPNRIKGDIFSFALLGNDKTIQRRLLLSIMIAVGQTLTGASAILYYSTYILQSLRFEQNTHIKRPHLMSEIAIGIAKLLGVCFAIALVDRVGRRRLLLSGSCVMLLSHIVFAISFWLAPIVDDTATLHSLCLWNLYIFIFAWNISWAPLMWVICSEVLPSHFRSIGMGVTFAVFWLGSAIINHTLLSLFDSIGFAMTFTLYAILTSVSNITIYFILPETSGLSYEKIEAIFSHN